MGDSIDLVILRIREFRKSRHVQPNIILLSHDCYGEVIRDWDPRDGNRCGGEAARPTIQGVPFRGCMDGGPGIVVAAVSDQVREAILR